MAGQKVASSALKLIRVALLGGVLVLGIVIAWLNGRAGHVPDPALGGVLRPAFLVMALGVLAGLAAVRAAQSRAAAEQRGGFAIVGWALGESTALFGGVAWLLAGEVLLYLTGVGVLLIAFLLVPVPEDT
jgi:hypothetical protein